MVDWPGLVVDLIRAVWVDLGEGKDQQIAGDPVGARQAPAIVLKRQQSVQPRQGDDDQLRHSDSSGLRMLIRDDYAARPVPRTWRRSVEQRFKLTHYRRGYQLT